MLNHKTSMKAIPSCVFPKGTDGSASERSREWLFCVLVPIANDKTMHPVTVAIDKSDALTDKPVSFHKLCRRTKLHPKTVKRYLELIQGVQSNGKIEVERSGFRVFIKKKMAPALPASTY